MDEPKMTRDDIIRMAESCGIPEFENNESQADNIMRFAALVASAERERIKQANAPEIERINAHIKELEDAVKKEREACAKVCEAGVNNATDWDSSAWDQACENRAAAIRRRSEIDSIVQNERSARGQA